MCNQYEAHEVYFYYACVKYYVIGYITSSCRDEWKSISSTIYKRKAQGHT